MTTEIPQDPLIPALVVPADAAALLQVSRQAVHQMIVGGELAARQVGDRWVIRRAEVMRLVKKRAELITAAEVARIRGGTPQQAHTWLRNVANVVPVRRGFFDRAQVLAALRVDRPRGRPVAGWCQKGLHRLVGANVAPDGRCRTCANEAQRDRRASESDAVSDA